MIGRVPGHWRPARASDKTCTMPYRKPALAASLMMLAGALAAGPAHADAPGLGDAAPLRMPDTSERSHAGVDVFFGSFDADQGGLFFTTRATVVSFEPHLDLALTDAITLSGRLPVAHARSEVTVLGVEDEASETLLGNVSLGGRYMAQVSRTLRAGGGAFVNLPTSEEDGAPGLADPATAAALAQLFHIERYLPATAALGLHGDLRVDVGRGFVQGRGELMFLVNDDDDDGGEDDEMSLLRFGVAAGFWLTPTLAAMAELTTLSTILDDEAQISDDEDEDFLHGLDLGVRYAQAQWSLSARFHLPLDDFLRENDLLGGGVDLSVYF